MLRGRVTSINLAGMVVDNLHLCTLKGTLKKESSQSKNLIAVGDYVNFCPETKIISSIEERTSVLSRADNLARRKEQLIAVNVDQVIITASVAAPSLKTYLIDRYIIAAQKGNMNPVILINKIDLLSDEAELEEFLQIYKPLFPVILMSSKTKQGLEDLKAILKNKTSVFSGQSGVGKSSLINALLGTNLKVGNIVEKTQKGAHTTSSSHLISIDENSFCIDTPGIRSFGVWDLTKEELRNYFPEFQLDCKYLDCSHINEPSCAVKIAVENNTISSLRYASYITLMENLNTEHKCR